MALIYKIQMMKMVNGTKQQHAAMVLRWMILLWMGMLHGMPMALAFVVAKLRSTTRTSFRMQHLHLAAMTTVLRRSMNSTPFCLDELLDTVTVSSSCLDRESILNRIQQQYMVDCHDSLKGPFQLEEQRISHDNNDCRNALPYEPIYAAFQDNNKNSSQQLLAIQSKKEQPLFNATTIETIRQAASAYWKNSTKHQTSRFTFQRPGNYEAHVSDLGNPAVNAAINDALVRIIYPLIRQVFWNGDENTTAAAANNNDNDESLRVPYKNNDFCLCVYDALLIRYNATEAADHATKTNSTLLWTCGQPFHRDIGLVTFNIMLNDPTEFVGGGTFLENQISPTTQHNIVTMMNHNSSFDPPPNNPLKPYGAGHFLAHASSERHAASTTARGVRDIMVIFVSAKPLEQQQLLPPPAARIVQSGMLKQCRVFCEQEQCVQQQQQQQQQQTPLSIMSEAITIIACRVAHLRLAVETLPTDGEAWQYLGIALMEYSDCMDNNNVNEKESFLSAAKYCLEQAAQLTPCDARVYNNYGLLLKRMAAYLQQGDEKMSALIKNAFSQALRILLIEESAGCDVANDLEGVILNYGLHLSYEDRYREACQILERVVNKNTSHSGASDSRIVEDVIRLWRFCRRQLTNQ